MRRGILISEHADLPTELCRWRTEKCRFGKKITEERYLQKGARNPCCPQAGGGETPEGTGRQRRQPRAATAGDRRLLAAAAKSELELDRPEVARDLQLLQV